MNVRRSVVCTLVWLSIWSAVPVRADEPAPAEIDRLLGAVESSSCAFYRNGARYSGREAADHLREKLRFAVRGRRIEMTGEQFIAKVASASSITGRPYLIDCGKGSQPLAGWLTTVLQETGRAP